MKRKNLITSIALGAATLAATAAVGYYAMSEHLFNKMIKRKQRYDAFGNPEDNEDLIYFGDLEEEIAAWQEATERENVYVVSQDDIELAGEWYHPEEDDRRWVIIARSNDLNHLALRNVAMAFHDEGYHALIVDCRGYGNSDGQYVGMGWQDRLDIQAWIDFILEQDPEALIALYGVSMSASAVVIASGEPLPQNVRCVIEDSGFTSAYEFLSEQIRDEYGFRASFIMEGLDTITRLRAKYSLKSASSIRQLRKSDLPTLFIHGEEDEFIPLDHVFRMYHALSAEKELYTVPYAGHGEAMFSPRYFERIMRFCSLHMH